jgi:hypothetical protein
MYVILIIDKGSRDIVNKVDNTGLIFFYDDIWNFF